MFQKIHLSCLLQRLDMMSMAASVEARVPLLDHSLAENIFSVSSNRILSSRFSEAKKTLKNALSKEVPTQIMNREKEGFNGPVLHWLNSEHSHFSNRLKELNSRELNSIISSKNLRALIEREDLMERSAETLYKLYVADCWFEKHA